MKLKLNDLFKRTCATVLAVACFMSSSAFMPIEKMVAWAVDVDFLFYFKHNISGEEISAAQAYILEGARISITDNLSELSALDSGNFSYNATNPFTLSYSTQTSSWDDDVHDIRQYLEIDTSTENRDAYIRPLVGFTEDSTFGNSASLEYILTPQVQYSLSRTGEYSMPFTYNAISYQFENTTSPGDYMLTDDPGGTTQKDVTYTLTKGADGSEQIHLIDSNNTIKIQYVSNYNIKVSARSTTSAEDGGTVAALSQQYYHWGLTPDGYPEGSIFTATDYWVIDRDNGGPTGYFNEYEISDVTFKLENNQNIGVFRMSKNDVTADDLFLTVNFGDMGIVKEIKAGNGNTHFTIDFSYETTANRLDFLVKNRQDAVEEVADLIEDVQNAYGEGYVPAYSKSNTDSTYLQYNHRPFIYSRNYTIANGNDIVLDTIQDDFYLKIRHSDYNYTNGFYIQWEWVPDGYNYSLGDYIDWDDWEKPTAPDRGDYVDDDDGYNTAYDSYKSQLESAEASWLAYDEDYWKKTTNNEELMKAVSIQEFGIDVEYDDGGNIIGGAWKGSNTTYLANQGEVKATVTSRTDDTSGVLRANVFMFGDSANYKAGLMDTNKDYNSAFYDGKGDTIPIVSTRVAEFPITITGKGEKPTFYVKQVIGATYESPEYNQEGFVKNYEAGTQSNFPVFVLQENADGVEEITEVDVGTSGSFNMDINNGLDGINSPPAEIPVGYQPPIPFAPYTVKGTVSFGSGIEKTESLVITNNTVPNSSASILMQYHMSANNAAIIDEYTFTENGETWEIPLTSAGNEEINSYEFTIIAKDEGLFNMRFEFYSSDSTYPKTSFDKSISIGSSLPSSEASLDKVYIHLVQDVEDPNNLTDEEQRIAEVLDSLYSDKSTTNSDNPLKGEYPTDILYNIDFTYNPAGYYYYEMELPYVISDVILTPIYEGIAITGGAYYMEVTDPNRANFSHTVTGTGYGAGDIDAYTDLDLPFALIDENQSSTSNTFTKWIEIKTLAADNATSELYYLKLVRQDAESTVCLDEMYVTTTDTSGDNITLDLNNASGTVVQFETDPVGVGARYYITLPYYYYANEVPVNITAISNGDWAKSPTIVSDDGLKSSTGFFASIANALSNKTTESFVLQYLDSYGSGTNATGGSYPNKFTITTYSEADDSYAEYYLTIYIQAPDTNDKLSNLQVLDPTEDDAVIDFKNGSFFSTKNDYIIEIPYELQKYRFSMLPDSDNALAVRLVAPDGTIIGTTSYASSGTPIQFLIDFNDLGFKSTDLNFTFTIAVQSEDGVWSDQYNHPEGHSPYTIAFQRSEPNDNSLLASLDIYNYNTAVALPEYVFEQVKKDYIFSVPYTTDRIIIKPIAQEQDYTDITINGVDFPDDDPGKDYDLTEGEINTFVIVVTAEDGSTTTYNLYITREGPDTEARLLNLTVNGSDSMTPTIFIPSVYEYDFTIPAGTLTYTVTPTAVSEYSVITIDGIVIPSGTATLPYNAVDEETTIYVYVSAQDGVTTQTYTLNITNHNLIEKSDDCTLLDLNLQGVDLAPKFLSNVYDYEVYTKSSTELLQIEPTASKGATVEVSVGSKKLDEINGIYSTSFFTDTDKITIKVTSESGTVSKSYVFDVYKNTEDKEGIFKPITSDDVDFVSENPIVVDISEYAVVDASVFITLKEKYPDSTLVLTGNDYMLRITGSDITDDIPHTTQYDFGFSFTSPEESLIQAILDDSEYEEDAELEPIYLYFNDHTALPGQMILTVILGSSVGNSQLYWNYYNTEYDRIDYYGYVQSNSKGTITVPLTHLSTYLVTTQEIGASEDRTNTGFGSLDKGNHGSDYLDGGIGTEGFGDDLTGGFGTGGSSGGDISGELTTNKPNPQTETDIFGFPISTAERGVYEQTTVYKWLEDKRNQRKKDDKLEEC